MKVVILAAGFGSRLRPLTNEMPKCMVEVNNVKIIEKQITNLLRNGIKEEEITVVTGYKTEKLELYLKNNYKNVNIIINKDYEKTNNMYSLYLTKNIVNNSDFILMNADVFFEENIIKELLNSTKENLMVCDDGRYIEESMKIMKKEDRIIEISKKIKEKEAYGVTIDVYKISKKASNKLFEIIREFIEVKKDLNSWTEVALNILLKDVQFDSLDMKYKWVEIDNHEDLKYATELF